MSMMYVWAKQSYQWEERSSLYPFECIFLFADWALYDELIIRNIWCFQDRTDGVTEVQLYFSVVTPALFRKYTIVAENVVGVTTLDTELFQSDVAQKLLRFFRFVV